MIKFLRRVLKSLRFRFFILLFLFGIAPGFLLRAGLLSTYEAKAVELNTAEISSQAKLLASQIVTHGYLDDRSSQDVYKRQEQYSHHRIHL